VALIFQDNSRHATEVIGRDEETDVAPIKIDTNQKLPYGRDRVRRSLEHLQGSSR
jgi:S1-C subfamily serine protease